MKTIEHARTRMRGGFNAQARSVGDVVYPFAQTGYIRMGAHITALRKGSPYGFGAFVMMFDKAVAYGSANWDADVAQVEQVLLPTDMIGVAGWGDVDAMKPADRDWPDWIYPYSNLTGSPTLAVLQAVWDGTWAQGTTRRRFQDAIIDVRGTSDPDMQDVKDSIDSTGFDTWLDDITAVTMYKQSQAGGIVRWLNTVQSHLIHTHKIENAAQTWTW